MTRYSDWIRDARNSTEYAMAIAKHTFAIEIARALDAKAITRAELARRLDVSPSYVTKVLRGDENLTFETAVRVARALEMEWKHHLAHRGAQTVWRDVYSGTAEARVPPQPNSASYQPLGEYSHVVASVGS